ncbi:MAG: Hsp33 family molecular chaperone HslO, partial [Eubacteriales bacterium]
LFDEFDIEYRCPCERDKYLRALVGLNEEDMNELRAAGEPVETCCRFCGKKFTFPLEELEEARAEARRKNDSAE